MRRDARYARTPFAVTLVLAIALGWAAESASQAPAAWKEKAPAAWKENSRVMVEEQIVARGVKDPRVLEAMRETPRHLFIPEEMRSHAYEDRPLPIGSRQTISQPYIVAVMTELLEPEPDDVILEIGTGSGYQAAVLSRLVKTVISIEILPELADGAREALRQADVDNVEVVTGDGYQGFPGRAPFDGIIVTAAPPEVPPLLVEQLAVGAKMVIPVGEAFQELLVLERTEAGVTRRSVLPVRFVPMTGEAQNQ